MWLTYYTYRKFWIVSTYSSPSGITYLNRLWCWAQMSSRIPWKFMRNNKLSISWSQITFVIGNILHSWWTVEVQLWAMWRLTTYCMLFPKYELYPLCCRVYQCSLWHDNLTQGKSIMTTIVAIFLHILREVIDVIPQWPSRRRLALRWQHWWIWC